MAKKHTKEDELKISDEPTFEEEEDIDEVEEEKTVKKEEVTPLIKLVDVATQTEKRFQWHDGTIFDEKAALVMIIENQVTEINLLKKVLQELTE